jgi:hypothetical protein
VSARILSGIIGHAELVAISSLAAANSCDPIGHLPGFPTLGVETTGHSIEHLEGRPGIGHRTDRGGEVATDLARLDVDVSQLRRGNGEGVSLVPGAAVGLFEASSDGEDGICLETHLIGQGGAPETCHPQHQRVIV